MIARPIYSEGSFDEGVRAIRTGLGSKLAQLLFSDIFDAYFNTMPIGTIHDQAEVLLQTRCDEGANFAISIDGASPASFEVEIDESGFIVIKSSDSSTSSIKIDQGLIRAATTEFEQHLVGEIIQHLSLYLGQAGFRDSYQAELVDFKLRFNSSYGHSSWLTLVLDLELCAGGRYLSGLDIGPARDTKAYWSNSPCTLRIITSPMVAETQKGRSFVVTKLDS